MTNKKSKLPQVISVYRGRKLVMRSIYTADAHIGDLRRAWATDGRRVTVLRRSDPDKMKSPGDGLCGTGAGLGNGGL